LRNKWEKLFLKKMLAVIGILVLGSVLAYVWVGRGSEEAPRVKYITVPVEKGTLKAEISSTGTLRPLVEVLVGTQVSGTIKELYADFESEVKKDQLIALIDPDRFQAKAQQARADVEAAKANLIKAEVTLSDELRTLRRKEGLIEKNSISQSEYDTAKTKADAAEAQVYVDKARVAQLEARLNEAELELKYARIVAPVSGIVTSRTGDVGQTVTASFQTPVLFKIAEDLTRMQVHTNVDEADIGRVAIGQKAVFSVPAFPDLNFEAVVHQIRNDPKVEQNVVTYNVVLNVNNDELRLRPGMTANVKILLDEVKDALMVPEQALRFSPPEGAFSGGVNTTPEIPEGMRRVWRVEGKDSVRPIDVKVGVHGTERIQIFSSDLNPGDLVAVDAISLQKKDGAKKPALRFRF
jgi:HlyD family secretion protein